MSTKKGLEKSPANATTGYNNSTGSPEKSAKPFW